MNPNLSSPPIVTSNCRPAWSGWRSPSRAVAGLCAAFLLTSAVPAVHAALERFGPLLSLQSTPANPRPGYPEWYQDSTGLALELLTPKSAGELNLGYDVFAPTDTTFNTTLNAEPFPTGWFLEHFYWLARSEFAMGASRARLTLALEASFGNAATVVAGDEVVFARIRFDLQAAPQAGDYLVLTPYSQHEFKNVRAGDRVRVTEDVGIAPAPAGFAGALRSKVGPFLTASAVAGGPELDLHVAPDGLKYLAAPLRIGPVTGSPLGAARNSVQVFFKLSGTTTTYPATPTWGSTNFSLHGRVKTTDIPTRTSLDRVTKTTSGSDRRLDVFASADATLPVRLPPAAASVKTMPVLSFILPGTTTKVTMNSSASGTTAGPTAYYWYQHAFANSAASNAVPFGTVVSVVDNVNNTFTGTVRDAIFFPSYASPGVAYNPTAKTISIKCFSTTNAITGTVPPTAMSPNGIPYTGVTYTAASNTVTIPNVVAPPADVILSSPEGASEVFRVTVK